MGAGVSTDKSSNITEALNKSTTKIVNKNEVDCSNKIEQFQANNIDYIDTSWEGGRGGNVTAGQDAGLMSKCVIESSDQKKLLEEIATDIAQEHSTDKGAAATFQLVSTNEQENKATIQQILESTYETVNNAKCDISVLQEQRNTVKHIKTGGGNITITQTGKAQSDCDLVAKVNVEVAKKMSAQVKQKTDTKIPSIIGGVIAAIVLLTIVGFVIYYMVGDEAPQRRAGMMANFPGYGGMQPSMMAPQGMPSAAAFQPQYAQQPSMQLQQQFQQPPLPEYMQMGVSQ